MLISLKLRSLSGWLLFSLSAVVDCFRIGIRLEEARSLDDAEAVLCTDAAIEPAGEPSERGCDIQSSDNESSHAFSISGFAVDFWRVAMSIFS